jgi:Arc/MetJ-type ribon-helix-helix transcriptional regulator
MKILNVSTMSLALDRKLHEDLKFMVNSNKIKYASFSDFIRKAIHEKLERENDKVEREIDYGF